MGKFNANPQKANAILQYFHKSRVAHSIKDLEKQLPSVASINGMQVKDYLQALSDDEKIHVEKIGSGNWYWSFPSEDKNGRQKALDDAHIAYDKINAVVVDLRERLADAQGQDEKEKEFLDAGGESREEMVARKMELEQEKKQLEKEMAAYSDTDPTELERKRNEVAKFKAEAEQYTDEIYAMESWFKNICQDEEGMRNLRASFYGEELDENDGILKELM